MPRPKTTCTIPGCGRDHWGLGYCNVHYFRFKRHGSPVGGRARVGSPIADRIAAYTSKTETGCWEWTGSIGPAGYGKMYDPQLKRPNHAHAIAYREFTGPIVPGMQIDHLCRNRRCCNPDHLEQVTPGENNRRAWAARRSVA